MIRPLIAALCSLALIIAGCWVLGLLPGALTALSWAAVLLFMVGFLLACAEHPRWERSPTVVRVLGAVRADQRRADPALHIPPAPGVH